MGTIAPRQPSLWAVPSRDETPKPGVATCPREASRGATGPKSRRVSPADATQFRGVPSGAAARPRVVRLTPAALGENAGRTIAVGPTRKHGAVNPRARSTGW